MENLGWRHDGKRFLNCNLSLSGRIKVMSKNNRKSNKRNRVVNDSVAGIKIDVKNDVDKISSGKNAFIEYVKGNLFEIIVFIMMISAFYLSIVKAGISTHDELANLYKVRMGIFFDEYKDYQGNRLGIVLFNAIPSYLMGRCNSLYIYKLYTVFGLIVACISFMVLCKKVCGKKTEWIAMLLFWLFAQFNVDHDGLYSFAFTYQMNIAYVFIALILYIDYHKTQKKGKLIASAIFYLCGAMSYECFVPYGVLFFIMDLYFLNHNKQLNIKNIIRDLWLHATLVIIYFGIYVFFALKSTGSNGDASIGTDLTIHNYLIAEWKYSFGMRPLKYMISDANTVLTLSTEATLRNLIAWVFIIASTVVLCRAVVKSEKMSLVKYIYVSIGCFVGTLLCGLLIALNGTHVEWMINGVVRSYGTSYYGYFFIIAWIAVTICALYHILPGKKIVLGVCGIAIAFISMFTFISNTYIIDYMAERQCRWDLYAGIVQTDRFAALEDGVQIYAPNYTGVHNDVNTLSNYANHIAGTNVTFINDPAQLDYSKSIYYLKYDTDNSALYLFSLYGDMFTDEIYVYRLDSMAGYGFNAERVAETGAANLAVDGNDMGDFETGVSCADAGVNNNYMTVSCVGMKGDTFTLVK